MMIQLRYAKQLPKFVYLGMLAAIGFVALSINERDPGLVIYGVVQFFINLRINHLIREWLSVVILEEHARSQIEYENYNSYS